MIVTENRKDFPVSIIKPFDVEIINADDFIYSLLSADKTKVLKAFDTLVKALKNPPLSKDQVSETLSKIGLLKNYAGDFGINSSFGLIAELNCLD